MLSHAQKTGVVIPPLIPLLILGEPGRAGKTRFSNPQHGGGEGEADGVLGAFLAAGAAMPAFVQYCQNLPIRWRRGGGPPWPDLLLSVLSANRRPSPARMIGPRLDCYNE
jgi:hypothetical protein